MDNHACSLHDLLKTPLLGCIVATFYMMGSGCAKAAEQETQEGRHSFIAESASVAITTLAQELEENFVYPDIGAAYANALRAKVAAGAYARFPTAADFATAVTRDLQAVNREGHLRLTPPGETRATSPIADVPDAGEGVVRAGWIAPSVGYMSVHGFKGNRDEYAAQMKRCGGQV